MRVAIYARVSTNDQAKAIDVQLTELREYAKARKMEVHAEYADVGVSGSLQSRPELDKLMADAKKRRFDAVLVWRFDRFARSTKQMVNALAIFRSLEIDFISFHENIDTSSPLGEMIFHVIAAMSQLERDIIRERVRGGIRNARANGKVFGRPNMRPDKEIIKYFKKGLPYRTIALECGTNVGAVQRALKKAGLKQ